MSESNGHLRNRIAQSSEERRKGFLYKVEEWQGVEILLRPMSYGELAEIGMLANSEKQGDREKGFYLSFIRQAYDPETGEQIFTEADMDQVKQLEGAVVADILQAARRQFGQEEIKKN